MEPISTIEAIKIDLIWKGILAVIGVSLTIIGSFIVWGGKKLFEAVIKNTFEMVQLKSEIKTIKTNNDQIPKLVSDIHTAHDKIRKNSTDISTIKRVIRKRLDLKGPD